MTDVVGLKDLVTLESLGGFTAAELQRLELQPLAWAVPDILPAGLTFLGGKPKVGKSLLMLSIALEVARGGTALASIPVGESRDVLYLALEDGPRRQRQRLAAMTTGEAEADWPDRLQFHWSWPQLHAGGIDLIEEWIESVPDPGLIVVDTYQRVRPPTTGRNIYAEDYEHLIPLHELLTEPGVAVVLVHHNRKELAVDDWIDALSGSTGLTGVADTIVALFRERGRHDATLKVTGRDLQSEPELALALRDGRWALLGDAAEYRLESTRARIIQVLGDIGPASPKQVAEHMADVSDDTVRQTMRRMADDEQLEKLGHGVYAVLSTLSHQSQRHKEEERTRQSDRSDGVTEEQGARQSDRSDRFPDGSVAP